MKNLTRDEIDFIIQALNAYWNESHDMLQNRNDLGDIQKKNLEYQKKESKRLMDDLEKLM